MCTLQTVAKVLLFFNFCMYIIVLAIGGWAVNRAIDHSFDIGKTGNTTGKGLDLPAHFSPIYFPMGNAATGFFVLFALIAGAAGVASSISGLNHIRYWSRSIGSSPTASAAGIITWTHSLPAASAAGIIAWTLTLLAMGFAWKEIDLSHTNNHLIAMEAFIIILSATQLFYIAAIHGRATVATTSHATATAATSRVTTRR